MTEKQYFLEPEHAVQKRYEALRSYFVDGVPAKVVAARFGYTCQYFRVLCTMFRQGKVEFFREPTKLGRKSGGDSSLDGRIMELRQHVLSIYDIYDRPVGRKLPIAVCNARRIHIETRPNLVVKVQPPLPIAAGDRSVTFTCYLQVATSDSNSYREH